MSIPLTRALTPVLHILTDLKTEDLAIQEPGVGWWLHSGAWHRVEIPEMTYARCHGIAVMAASQQREVITPSQPIMTADVLGDIRLHGVMPPGVPRGTMALSFRRGDMRVDPLEDIHRLYRTSRWNKWSSRRERVEAQDAALLECYDNGDLAGFLQGLADTRKTGIVLGSIGAGKSRLSKLIGGLVSRNERIIAIEDGAAELVILQPNNVRHFYSASGAGVKAAAIFKATLRERPDRVILGEMRDPEAASVFMSDVMVGHPGSWSTLHGKDAPEAARWLFSLVKSSPGGQAKSDDTVLNDIANTIDFLLPVENDGGMRDIAEIWFRPDAKRRGETFHDLLRMS